jgi:hypothetical protein
MNLQENIDRIHQMMGIITEDKKPDAIKKLIDKLGLFDAIKFMGGYDRLKKYLIDDSIPKQEKEDVIKDIRSHISHHFEGDTQGVEGIELNDNDMIKIPENSDDEYEEFISKIGEDGVLVTIFNNGDYEDDYNIGWGDLPMDLFIKVFEVINNLNN